MAVATPMREPSGGRKYTYGISRDRWNPKMTPPHLSNRAQGTSINNRPTQTKPASASTSGAKYVRKLASATAPCSCLHEEAGAGTRTRVRAEPRTAWP